MSQKISSCVKQCNERVTPNYFLFRSGSPSWTRTSDIWINSPPFYQLNYRGIQGGAMLIALLSRVKVRLLTAYFFTIGRIRGDSSATGPVDHDRDTILAVFIADRKMTVGPEITKRLKSDPKRGSPPNNETFDRGLFAEHGLARFKF